MNNQAFDDQIRSAMENIGTDYKPETWDLLEQRLDSILPENIGLSAEEQFDAIIREKIANRTPNYNPNHWIIMSSILDEYQSVRAWLARYRVLETALTIMFVFTFVNVFHIPVQFPNLVFKAKNNSTNVSDVVKNQSPLVNPTIAVTSEKNTKTLPYYNNERNENSISSKNTEINTNTANIKREIQVNSIQETPSLSIKNIITQPQLLPAIAIAPIAEVVAKSLVINKIKSKIGKWKFSAGLASSIDFDRVMTPEFYSFGTLVSEFEQTRHNLNIGFLTEIKHNRWSLESGLLYGKKTYLPAEVRQNTAGTNITTAAYKVDLQDIRINILQLPTMLHFDFIKRKRWDVYLAAGTTANFITEAKYDYSRSFIGYALRPLPPAEPSITEPRVKSAYEDGMFITKSLENNVFFTANTSLGVTYRLTPKFNVYSQMMYRTYLPFKGIGPNQDKINSTSLLLGFKKEF